MGFRAGQQVVCVDAAPNRHVPVGYRTKLEKGAVYTVLRAVVCSDGFPAVLLVEVQPSQVPGWPRDWFEGFRPERFRPVVKPKREASTETGMTLLREIAERETIPGKVKQGVA